MMVININKSVKPIEGIELLSNGLIIQITLHILILKTFRPET